MIEEIAGFFIMIVAPLGITFGLLTLAWMNEKDRQLYKKLYK